MLEIEQKFRRVDFADLERRLAGWGVTACAEHSEADQYFNAPDRDFGRTGEAFRLRRVGTANCLTYKGPKLDLPVKARTEIEVPLGAGAGPAADMEKLLSGLGYRPVAVVRKRRRQFTVQRGGFDLTVCLDEVDELGRFAEVEILTPEDQLDAARVALTAAADDLGLADVERRSYLTMLLAARG